MIDFIKKKLNKSVVLCHGCFDVFHRGHLSYLKQSKLLGDVLVVSITDDAFIKKGNDRPVFNIQDRLELINELKCVDYCCVSHDFTCVDIIKSLKPNIYSKGSDVKGKELDDTENLFYENKELLKYGGILMFIDIVPNISTTKILNQIV